MRSRYPSSRSEPTALPFLNRLMAFSHAAHVSTSSFNRSVPSLDVGCPPVSGWVSSSSFSTAFMSTSRLLLISLPLSAAAFRIAPPRTTFRFFTFCLVLGHVTSSSPSTYIALSSPPLAFLPDSVCTMSNTAMCTLPCSSTTTSSIFSVNLCPLSTSQSRNSEVAFPICVSHSSSNAFRLSLLERSGVSIFCKRLLRHSCVQNPFPPHFLVYAVFNVPLHFRTACVIRLHFAIFHRSLSLCDMGGRPRRWVSRCPPPPWSSPSSSASPVCPPLSPSFSRRNLSCASFITALAWSVSACVIAFSLSAGVSPRRGCIAPS